MAKCRNCGNITSFSRAGFRQKTGLCLSCYRQAKQVKRGTAEFVRYFYGYKHRYFFTSTPLHPHFDSGYTLEEIEEMSPEERSGEITFVGIQSNRVNFLKRARVQAAIGLVNGPSMLFL